MRMLSRVQSAALAAFVIVVPFHTPQVVIISAGVDRQGPAPRGSAAHLRVGDWSHDLIARPRMRILVRRGQVNRFVTGLAGLQHVDVLFDFDRRQIGLRDT